MNLLSRTITGGIAILAGLVLIIISLFLFMGLLFYGLIIFVIGLIIFFNKKEDEIEQIKTKGGKNKK